MLRKILIWRRDYKTSGILEEQLGSDLENVMHQKGRDRDGHPLFYIIYGAFKDKELYKKAFGTEEKCKEFRRWWVQYMEKGIKKLSFSNGGVYSAVQIIDLNNSLRPRMKELRSINKETIMLVQDYYPKIIHKVAGVTMVWDISIVGWEVSYKEEFIPDDEGSYIILVWFSLSFISWERLRELKVERYEKVCGVERVMAFFNRDRPRRNS
ncbi:Patellin-3 [Morella rubra]|uniref:Patellin-3 n=1 Tax=Morella rubra TaxID=262757 RepID=A0A6A1W5E7_9ROSI|nr:Patellin-3 [Morella rubra]